MLAAVNKAVMTDEALDEDNATIYTHSQCCFTYTHAQLISSVTRHSPSGPSSSSLYQPFCGYI